MLEPNSIFFALYYGNISPWENSQLSISKEYRRMLDTANELQERVNALLGDEGKQLFDEFLKADAKVGNCFEQEKFKEGFMIGAKLMIETFGDKRFNT